MPRYAEMPFVAINMEICEYFFGPGLATIINHEESRRFAFSL